MLLAATLLAACTTSDVPAPETQAKPSNPALAARARKLFELALGAGQAHALLRELCTEAPHRLSGSEGAERAVAWAETTMRQLGLANVRREKVMVPRWVRGTTCDLRLVGEGWEEPLAALALGNSVGTPAEGVSAEVLMVRSLEQARALGASARGKILFFNRPMPRALVNTFQAYGQTVDQRGSGAIEAGRVGAVACLVRSMTTSQDDFPHTGGMHYDDAVPKVPAVALSTKAAERLARLIETGASVRVELTADCALRGEVESANVIGEIPGSERPEEIVLIGGHLDAWDIGQGAHDDGAGCVHCLEAARLILAAGLRPKRTIRVVLFMNEENGLRGAHAYARVHALELPRHVAAIESDSGGFLPLGFSTSLPEEGRAAARAIAASLAPYELGALIPGGGGADISVLQPAGVPLFSLVISPQRYFDVHHCDRDRIENVNERELALGAFLLAQLASGLADA